ncbi:MAG: hypothetical protein ABI588_07860 [Arenimonas sp.]
MKDLDAEPMAKSPRALFERSVQGLDLGAANRLRLARRAALADGSAARSPSRAWLPAFATATLLVLGLAWWLPQRAATPVPAGASAAVDAVELVEDGDDSDLYAWLGEAPVAAEAGTERSL